jgi:hypothetical protein
MIYEHFFVSLNRQTLLNTKFRIKVHYMVWNNRLARVVLHTLHLSDRSEDIFNYLLHTYIW